LPAVAFNWTLLPAHPDVRVDHNVDRVASLGHGLSVTGRALEVELHISRDRAEIARQVGDSDHLSFSWSRDSTELSRTRFAVAELALPAGR
jgi:hypothetical protein